MCGYGSRRVSDAYRTCNHFFTQSFMVPANQSSYSSAKHVGLLHPRMEEEFFYQSSSYKVIHCFAREMYNLNCNLISSQYMVLK